MTDTTLAPVTNTTTDLNAIRTPKTGKMLKDFEVPEKFLNQYPELVAMILRSESMNDGERQYWFNLTEVMNTEQVEKLRGILTREREKLAEIEAKYGPTQPTLTTAEIAERNQEIQQKREQQQAALRAKEAASEATENDDAILSEFDSL
jgi:hypothetical protein